MQSDNLIKVSAGAVLGVVLLVALALPIISSATETHTTFTNDGAYYVEADPETAYTIEYDKTVSTHEVTINGEVIELSTTNGYTILALDDAILRFEPIDVTFQFKGNGQYLAGLVQLDLTVSGGSVSGTYTKSGGTQTTWPDVTYTSAYIASPDEQALIMTEYGTTSKLNGDSEIFAFGQTSVSGTLYLFKIEGNIDDGVSVSCLNTTSGDVEPTVTVSDISVNKASVDGYRDLYNVVSITFNATKNNVVTACTYTAYIVPAEVTAEKATHLNDSEIALIELVPLLAAVGLILGIIAYAIRARLN